VAVNTATISGLTVAERLKAALPGIVLEATEVAATVPAERVAEAARFLRDDPDLDCKYLNTLLGVDWLDHFDMVYIVSSLAKNHMLTLKARVANHEMPVVPSVNPVWMGANLQEREVYDLMGIAFTDHPNLRRIFLWDGFPGHPLRKDFLSLPGGFKPGLQRFPFEFPAGQSEYAGLQGDSPSAPPVPRLDQPPPEPFPIEGRKTAERLTEHAQLDDEAQRRIVQPQGAGSDVSLAGGTAEAPADTPERGHVGPGAAEGEEGREGQP
jgi:NADH-quinone oxidoreductase subunit C